MNNVWALEDDKRTLVTPRGFRVRLEREAINVAYFRETAVVLLSYREVSSSEDAANAVAYTDAGEKIWQMAPPHQQQLNFFTGMRKLNDDTVLISDAVMATLHVNPRDGEVLQIDETR